MTHRLACLMLAGLACSAHVISASKPPNPAGDVDILVDGALQRRYAHDGRWYVEAVKGKEYAIRLRNPFGVRVAVALSVDGLNTIDARHTTAAGARKWVLGPHETVTISGWQTSSKHARRFEFTTEARSYAQALGKTANLGTIAAVFFKERVPRATIAREESHDNRARPGPGAPAARTGETASALSLRKADEEYAATGMGRVTDHAITTVWLDLEETPAQTVSVRYEFREQLVRLGIVKPSARANPLERRERAQGFEAGFAPEPPHW